MFRANNPVGNSYFVNPEALLIAAICLAFGAIVQSVIGFGMGVVAIPLLVWGGWSLPEAIGIVIPNVLLQTALNCWQNRDHLPWQDVGVLFVFRLVFLPIGIFTLRYISDSGEQLTRQLLGVGLIGMLILQQMTRNRSINLRGPVGTFLAGSSSGFLAGLLGMGGPPLVFWAMGQNWPTERQRAFLWLTFLFIVPLQLIMMGVTFGRQLTDAMVIGFAVSPMVLIIAWWGARIGNSMSKERIRLMMQLFLVVIAVRLIFWG